MENRKTAKWGEVRGWSDLTKRKKDSWTRTTMGWVIPGERRV